MGYKFFFISADIAKLDPTVAGYAYAKQHESEWVDGPSTFNGNITTGVAKGIDNVIYQDKAYAINKLYFDVENSQVLVICIESVLGCDVKETFNV